PGGRHPLAGHAAALRAPRAGLRRPQPRRPRTAVSRLAALAWLLCGVLIGATLAYAVEVPSRSTTTYPFKWGSVDTMKESKDKEASSLTAAQIASDVNLAATLNTSHISVDTHMEYPAVMGQWVAAVRHT